MTTARIQLTEKRKQQEIEATLIVEQANIQPEKEQAEEKEPEQLIIEEKPEPKPDMAHSHDANDATIDEENTSPDNEFNMAFAVTMFFIFLGTLSGGAYYYFIYRPKHSAKKTTENQTSPTQPPAKEKNEFEDMGNSSKAVDLDLEESIGSALSDLEIDENLEDELSSILETEMDKLK